MKYLLAAAFLIVAYSYPVFSQADSVSVQPDVRWEIMYSAGLSLPYLPKDFKQDFRTGYNAGIGAGYSFTPGSFGYGGVYGSIQFNSFGFDESGFKEANNLHRQNYSIYGSATQILTVTAQFKGTFGTDKKSIAPYFTFGIGYLHIFSPPIMVSGDTTLLIGEKDEGAFSWIGGLGVDFPVTDHLTIFLEGRYGLGITTFKSTQYVPISVGIRSGI